MPAAAMRPILAIVIATVILGSVQLYMLFQSRVPIVEVTPVAVAAAGEFRIELTLTFDAAPDPFEGAAVVVQFGDQTLARIETKVPAGQPVTIPEVQGVVEGPNAFFVQVAVGDDAALVERAVRIRIFRDDTPLAERTVWSAAGDVVGGEILVDVPKLAGPDPADHADDVEPETAP